MHAIAKGQLISKADWRAMDSPKKTNGQICFVCFFTLHGKQIKFVLSFLGEPTAHQSAFRSLLTFTLFRRPCRKLTRLGLI